MPGEVRSWAKLSTVPLRLAQSRAAFARIRLSRILPKTFEVADSLPKVKRAASPGSNTQLKVS